MGTGNWSDSRIYQSAGTESVLFVLDCVRVSLVEVIQRNLQPRGGMACVLLLKVNSREEARGRRGRGTRGLSRSPTVALRMDITKTARYSTCRARQCNT